MDHSERLAWAAVVSGRARAGRESGWVASEVNTWGYYLTVWIMMCVVEWPEWGLYDLR